MYSWLFLGDCFMSNGGQGVWASVALSSSRWSWERRLCEYNVEINIRTGVRGSWCLLEYDSDASHIGFEEWDTKIKKRTNAFRYCFVI